MAGRNRHKAQSPQQTKNKKKCQKQEETQNFLPQTPKNTSKTSEKHTKTSPPMPKYHEKRKREGLQDSVKYSPNPFLWDQGTKKGQTKKGKLRNLPYSVLVFEGSICPRAIANCPPRITLNFFSFFAPVSLHNSPKRKTKIRCHRGLLSPEKGRIRENKNYPDSFSILVFYLVALLVALLPVFFWTPLLRSLPPLLAFFLIDPAFSKQ